VKRLRICVVLIMMSGVVVAITPGMASAHGNCDPNGSSNRTWVNGWSTAPPTPYYIKGQTYFRCDGAQTHATITVDVRFLQCYVGHRTGTCNTWSWGAPISATCYNKAFCQKTITSPQCNDNGYIYIAYGRWRALNANGGVAHQNPEYPGYRQQWPLPLNGAHYC
jgi:hypothetical protein